MKVIMPAMIDQAGRKSTLTRRTAIRLDGSTLLFRLSHKAGELRHHLRPLARRTRDLRFLAL